MVERSGPLVRPRCRANSFIRLEAPIGNDRGRARCAALKTRNIRRISIGFRGFRGGNRGKSWMSRRKPGRPRKDLGQAEKGTGQTASVLVA